MISALDIRAFKRLVATRLEFAPLTVLTGLNGAGKTTVLQALLLAREASTTQSGTVPLNGPFGLELGTVQDVLNLHAAVEASEIQFTATLDDGSQLRVVLDASNAGLLNLPIRERIPEPAANTLGDTQRAFTYLSADRLGPKDVLGASAIPTQELAVGTRGEFAAHVLAVLGLSEKVSVGRRHPARQDDTFLKYQVEAWLSEIVRPTEIDAVWFPNTAVTALRFRSPGGDWVRAPNMGFGVSYSLPIVLAGLLAPARGMVLVENPEAHLHPAGQSSIGVFLAMLASDGVQVVVETHSDHVLNGIRRAIAELKRIPAERAIVHFFDVDADGMPDVATLKFTAAGGLSAWPSRFFDQYEMDVAALARARRALPK